MIALGAFLSAFLLSYAGTLGLLKVRVTRGFIDVPNERSSHEAPKPRTGGVAIVLSFYAVLAYLVFAAPQTRLFLPFAAASGLLFLTGVVDDWRGLGVRLRFLMQFVAVIVVVLSGLTLDHVYIPAVGNVELGWFAVPITCLFVMGSINFYNFIDGIDGLAAGSAFFTSGFLSLIAMLLGHIHLALVFVTIAGSTVGFLQFNFPPSRLFMGDSGSTFLGFFFAYAALAGNRLTPELPVFIPVLILSSLYLDAGLTLASRIIKRENIFQAHHTHYYQRLLSLGLNHKQVTLLEYGLVILLGASAVVYFKAGAYFPVFLSVCWLLLFTLVILKIRGLERGEGPFWEKRILFVIGVDLLAIVMAYLGAYFLRMNFRFTDPEGMAVLRALPIVLVVRSACFFKFGLYRSVWKYTSTADVVKIIKAVTMGSAIILTAVVLLYRFVAFPRTLFIIEYFLLNMLVMGSRFSYRLFHEIGKEAHGAFVRRFGIVGAGDFGERIGRELRNDENRAAAVVCYVDDDKGKIGLTLQGVPIVGPVSRLKEICRELALDGLVIGIANLEGAKLRRIVQDAQAAGAVVEGRHGPMANRPEPTVVTLDRLRRGLGRPAPPPAGLNRMFYRGKRVLITEGSARIAPALARELLALEARVAVLLGSPVETARFDDEMGKGLTVVLGPTRARQDFRRVVQDYAPDVVFHCVELNVTGIPDPDWYLWDAAVDRPRALCSALEGTRVSSLVVLSFWDGIVAGPGAAVLGAACETLVLNDPLLKNMAPKVVRMPRTFFEHELAALNHAPAAPDYDLLEPEAVELAVGCPAAEPGSALIVPAWRESFSAARLKSILEKKPAELDEPGNAAEKDTPGLRTADLLFPVERLEKSRLEGARRVVSPVFPAGDTMGKVLSEGFLAAGPDERGEWLRLLKSSLYRIHAPGVQPVVDN